MLVMAHRSFWGPELVVARRPGAQGRFALTLAGGDYEGALGVRVAADAQLLLRPGERVGLGPYGGLGLAFVGAEGARGAGYLTALLGVEAVPGWVVVCGCRWVGASAGFRPGGSEVRPQTLAPTVALRATTGRQ